MSLTLRRRGGWWPFVCNACRMYDKEWLDCCAATRARRVSLTLHCLLLLSTEAAANSTLLIDPKIWKCADIVVEMRQTTCGLEFDPCWRFIASPLDQERIILSCNFSDMVDWQRRGFDAVVACCQTMSQDTINSEFKTISFCHSFQSFDRRCQ